jgi:hypothetical protein
MTLRRFGFSLVMVVSVVTLGSTSASADDLPACSDNVDLYGAHQFCNYSGEQFHILVTTHVEGVSYSIRPMCVETQSVQDSCVNQQRCEEPPDTWKFLVFRSGPGTPDVPWGTVCLDTDTAEQFDVITPGKVFKEMVKLEWPSAELVIQPPDGRTLVNFETNFMTTTTQPTSQSIQLLGHGVEIEATPVSYTWHFGDGMSQSGADPGAEYPDMRITHVYVTAGVTVSPSVDVTYQGRYRIDGGNWVDIPDTLTIDGTAVDLDVLSATPHLVG